MRCVIAIPARLQSTRLPQKLLQDRTGIPLICHTVIAAGGIMAKAPGLFSEVVVAVDSPELLAAVQYYQDENQDAPVRAVMTDPALPSGSDRVAAAIAGLPPDVDCILNLQGDEPEVDADEILQMAAVFADSGADIATMAYLVADEASIDNPNLVKAVLDAGNRALYFSRSPIPCRRDPGFFLHPYYGHVGVYLYRRSALERFVSLPPGKLEQTERLEQLRALENGMSIVVRVASRRPAKGIDTPEDYEEFVMRWKAGNGG